MGEPEASRTYRSGPCQRDLKAGSRYIMTVTDLSHVTHPRVPSYCGEHMSEREKVPCHLDPAHTCAAWGLARHLRVCNSLA